MGEEHHDTVIAGFTDEQVCRLTGVTRAQLRYWARGFLPPSLRLSGEGRLRIALYSFRDVACLKVIHALRNEAKVSLQHLREVKDRLSHLGDDMWARTTLHVLNRRVIFVNPETGGNEEVVSGQGVLQIPLAVVTGNLIEAIRRLRQRPASDHGRITARKPRDPRPLIAGTRIPVHAIQDFASAGYTTAQIVEQYPSITEADVLAAVAYKPAASDEALRCRCCWMRARP